MTTMSVFRLRRERIIIMRAVVSVPPP